MIAAYVPWMAGLLGLGGLGALASRRAELRRRWLTWAGIFVVTVVAFAVPPYGPAVLAAGCGVLAALEYRRLAGLHRSDLTVLLVAAVALPVLAGTAPDLLTRAVPLAALAGALPALLTQDGATGARRAASTAFGLLWLAPLVGFVLLGSHALPLLVAVSAADVGGWCGGKLLRGPRLSRLSPAKTWGGVLGSAAVGVLVLALLGSLTWPLAVAVLLGAPLGDLLESMVKRGAGVKDAGRLLPGFGGVLDRIDSLLVALAIALVLS